MRRSVSTLAVVCASLALACGLSGCSIEYPYDLRVTVRAFPTGEPLADVRLTLVGDDLRYEKRDAVTGKDGSVQLRFGVGPYWKGTLPKWTLTLEKEGFATESVDISPSRDPRSEKGIPQIVVAAYMKAG